MGIALQAALDKLDLVDVGHRAGLSFERLPGSGHGACRDPFRPDDKHPSFQVVADGSGRAVGFKDYASDATGNLWAFAQRCWPDKSAGDLASLLIDMAGTGHLEESASGKAPMTYKERQAEDRKARAAQRKRVETRLTDQTKMPEAAVPPVAPLAIVSERFEEGCSYALQNYKLIEGLADRRGWSDIWVEELVNTRRLSLALLPWVDARVGKQLRGWAFAVECPESPMHEGVNKGLVAAGYHQSFQTQDGKAWVFAPYMPASEEKARSRYQREMLAAYKSQGRGYGEKLIDPVPFVIGYYDARLVIIVEGQWDAVSFFGALGGFLDGDPISVLIFGLRGVQSGDQLLRYWGRLLKWLASAGILTHILVMADADKAGMALVQTRSKAGEVPTLSFADRLKELIGARVVTTRSKTNKEDFNDWYKRRKPSVSEMWKLLEGMGVA